MNFVCAFRGRRDSYEVPLALAESGRLERFVTDFFQTRALSMATRAFPTRIRQKLLLRAKAGIPLEKVECMLGTTLLENLLIGVGRPPAATHVHFDATYSRVAESIARESKADLLLYSPYALPAFSASYEHNPLKVLFQYHPHAVLERSILGRDQALWRSEGLEFSDFLVTDKPPAGLPEYESGWKYSDHIICASTFTKQSLVEIGAVSESISVVPYGVDATDDDGSTPSESANLFHVLFVGTGIQRKGLHHLLFAWQRAKLGEGARLTIVSRSIEPSLKALVERTPGAALRSDVGPRQLEELYRGASLFCMPSLVEGFGQVYLEALSHGLPVLGTPNTCIPDLGTEEDGVFSVEAGNVDALAEMLMRLSIRVPRNAELRRAARDCSRRFTWAAFRRRIGCVLDSLERGKSMAKDSKKN
jgi:glycosyltransferase involved in cell wall biosynthesis